MGLSSFRRAREYHQSQRSEVVDTLSQEEPSQTVSRLLALPVRFLASSVAEIEDVDVLRAALDLDPRETATRIYSTRIASLHLED